MSSEETRNADHPLARYSLQRRQLGAVMRGPDGLVLPRPRRDEYMTCTAVASDAVFTARA